MDAAKGWGMTEAWVGQLFDVGGVGLFAAFLVWLYIQTQRRADAEHRRFTEALISINESYDERVKGMRSRYTSVINQLRAESKEQQDGYTARLDVIDGTLKEIRVRLAAQRLRGDADITGELEQLTRS